MTKHDRIALRRSICGAVMTLTPEERRFYADPQWRVGPNPVLERMWGAYVALDTEADQLSELVHSLEQQRADLAEELAAVKAQREASSEALRKIVVDPPGSCCTCCSRASSIARAAL